MAATFPARKGGLKSSVMDSPILRQLAALCMRKGKKGDEVLLVTSSRGRWILPKGWPMKGVAAPDAAMQEAWEEGGVRDGKVGKTAIGSFDAVKLYDDGEEVPVETEVYRVRVSDMAKKYPEDDRRERIWVSPRKAARMVDEPGLKNLLKDL